MSGGGGTPIVPQDNSLQVEQLRQQQAQNEQQRLDAKAAQDKTDFNTNLANAVTGAKSTGMSYLGQRGLSGDQYGGIIDQIIGDTRSKVPQLDPNPGSYFTSDIFGTGLDTYQGLQRGNANSQVQTAFQPGYESTYLPDTADDSIINSILGTQRGTAQTQVDYQKKRGLLNDTGYNAAEQRLGDQEAAARSTLSGIGSGVINKDRGDLSAIVANAGSAANNWTLGAPAFSVDPYRKQVTDRAGELNTSLEGDIKAGLGGTQLFDIPSIIAAGGTAQGPQNLTTADTISGIPSNKKNNVVNRGLGSTGTF